MAAALQERHLAAGSMADLDQAIELYGAALDDMASGPGVYASTLNNLATALNDRFERTADPADRDRARHLLQQSVESTDPASVQRDRHVANLAGHMTTPDEALAARRRLVDTPSANPAVRAADRNNLATSLIDEFLDTHDPSDLDEAIDLLEEALDLVDADSPDLPLYSLNCGNARRLRFIFAADPDEQMQHLMRGLDVLDVAVSSGLEVNPQIALKAARHAGDWYAEVENWGQAAEVYRLGLSAADSLLRVQLGRRDKETWLKAIGDLPSQAAYANVEAGDPPAAALVMEHGHAILLAEALDLKRADIDRLATEGRADLGERFRALAARWHELSSSSA
jgi:tetratricopeptide (TPR) repeat protein